MTDVLTETTNEPVPRKNAIGSSNDRTASVSKDDIEMMRGRALNINDSEHQKKSSGILYVTAPATESLRSNGNKELSDVSMDDDEPFETHLNKGELKLPSDSGKLIHIKIEFFNIFNIY